MIPNILKRILPSEISAAADKINEQNLFEIRLRGERPVAVNYGGKYFYLTKNGLSQNAQTALQCSVRAIRELLIRATEYSLYAVNDQICQGYLTIEGGIRIGIAGETVWSDNAIRTIKNYGSVNIRLPHAVSGCADRVMRYIVGEEIKNTILISPPGAGKTTLLRDIAKQLSGSACIRNVLVVDERNELAAMHDGKMLLDVGCNADIMNACNKEFAFSRAIRALRPDIIITDELCDGKDVTAVAYAVSSGVRVITSAHAVDHLDLMRKPGFEDIVRKRIFDCYINISSRRGPGTIDGIFDENLNAVYCP